MASLQDLQALPKAQQAGIIGGVLLVIALIFAYWGYKGLGILGPDPDVPAFLRRDADPASIWADIEEAERKIVTAQGVIAQADAVNAKLEALQDEIAVARGLLPQMEERDQVRDLIQRYMREVPSEYGPVTYRRVNIVLRGGSTGRGRQAAAQPEQEMVYQFELTAGMEGLIAFIQAVETSTDRFMMVERVTIEPGTVEVDESILEMTYTPHLVRMDIVTYVYQEGAR